MVRTIRAGLGVLLALLLFGPALEAGEDIIYLNTGGVIKGEIIAETAHEIRIKAFGVEMQVFREDVQRIERDAAGLVDKQYTERLAAIDDPNPDAHFQLARWLENMERPELARAEYEKAVAQDPAHAGARQALGLPAYVPEPTLAELLEEDPEAAQRQATTFRGNLPAFLREDLKGLVDLDPTARKQAQARILDLEAQVHGFLKAELESEDERARLQAISRLIRTDEEISDLKPGATAGHLVEADWSRIDGAIDAYIAKEIVPAVAAYVNGQATALKKAVVKRFERLERLVDATDEARRTALLEHYYPARAEALETIFDKSIYPDENHGAVGQPTVDEKVDVVKAVWEELDALIARDVSRFLQITPREARQYLEEMEGLADALAGFQQVQQTRGWKPVTLPERPSNLQVALLSYRAGDLDRAYRLSKGTGEWGQELLRRLRAKRVEEYNDGLVSGAPLKEGTGKRPTTSEREQVRITNEYRIMMGREPLELNLQLVETARGHSAEMTRLGYFEHESPVAERRSPSMRAQLSGYPGGVAENISLGSVAPRATHIAWYNSSGHHRNILSPGHRCMASGQDGNHWTQNFGGVTLLKR